MYCLIYFYILIFIFVYVGKPLVAISTLDSMARKKMCALLHKHGVTVGCIAGSTSFINEDGKLIGVGVCCWYFGNMLGAKPQVIDFSFLDDSFDTTDDNNLDDEEDDDELGLSRLFHN